MNCLPTVLHQFDLVRSAYPRKQTGQSCKKHLEHRVLVQTHVTHHNNGVSQYLYACTIVMRLHACSSSHDRQHVLQSGSPKIKAQCPIFKRLQIWRI